MKSSNIYKCKNVQNSTATAFIKYLQIATIAKVDDKPVFDIIINLGRDKSLVNILNGDDAEYSRVKLSAWQ